VTGATGREVRTEALVVVGMASSNAIEHAYADPGPADQLTVSF
jgi:hypothetical protein